MARAVAMAVVVVVKGAAVARARGAQAGRRSRHLQNYGVNVGGSAAGKISGLTLEVPPP